MPRRRTHGVVGAISGGVAVLAVSRGQDPVLVMLKALAGACGGWHGGVLPDVLEPATSPGHRSIAHSALALVGGTAAVINKGSAGLEWAKTYVRALEAEFASTRDRGRRLVLGIRILAWELSIAYAVGLATGYGTHLLLDAGTPADLPLIG